MIQLRNFTTEDAEAFQQRCERAMSLSEIKAMFAQWNEKEYAGKWFEMFAVLNDGKLAGMVSLYQQSESAVSCGPEIFPTYRKQGIGQKAMELALEIAKSRGYKIVLQQIRADNAASLALHRKLGFETNGYEYQNQKGNTVLLYFRVL